MSRVAAQSEGKREKGKGKTGMAGLSSPRGTEQVKPRDIGERTFGFALSIVRLCRVLETRSGVARGLSRQLLRSGTSIGANVQEAQAGQSRADFANKYAIALKEARETVYWLRLVVAAELTSDGKCRELMNEAQEIAKIIGAIIVKTKARGDS